MPLLHVLASLPNTRWNPSWSSVCRMIILLQRVCPGPFVSFFFFVTLVYVYCGGDIGTDDDGRKHSIFHSQTRDLGIWWMMTNSAKECSFEHPVINPGLRELLFDKWTLAWSVVPRVFLNNLLIFLVDRFMVWCAVAVCHTCYRLRGCFPYAFTVFPGSMSTWNATSQWSLVGKRHSLGHLFYCPSLLCEYWPRDRQRRLWEGGPLFTYNCGIGMPLPSSDLSWAASKREGWHGAIWPAHYTIWLRTKLTY